MKIVTSITFVLLAFMMPLMAQSEAQVATSEEQAIKDCFENYMKGIKAKDGLLAVSTIDQSSIAYYQAILDMVMKGKKEEIESRSAIDRMTILTMRHKFEKGLLSKQDGESLLVLSVNEGMVGSDGLNRMELGELNITGKEATANAVIEGQATPLNFEFIKEKEGWKFKLIGLITHPMIVSSMDQMMKSNPKGEEAFLFEILEMMTGNPVDEKTIWTPVNDL